VDYLSDGFDAVARYNGGSNAGHTVVVGSSHYRFHLVPSGAVKGKKLLVGAGVALDPVILKEELKLLAQMGTKPDIVIDGRCTLVSPLEKEFDGYLESLRGASAIGTTGRGIGPAYAARALRMSPRAMDLFSKSFNLQHMLRFYRGVLGRPPDLSRWLGVSRSVLRGRLGDVSSAVRRINDSGGAVLFEAAHGTMLDIQHGTYPFVTSSSSLASYAPTGLGIPASSSRRILGVTKAYATRVGAGPFPTEQKGMLADSIRSAGNEYGTTTGRPRRIGWLDLVALKYAVRMNGAEELALSKIDILAKVRSPLVCVAYSRAGSESGDFYRFMGNLDGVRPVYKELPSLYGAEFRNGVPAKARKLIEVIEDETGARVKLLSYGEERGRTIEL